MSDVWDWRWEVARSDLPKGPKLVCAVLSYHFDEHGRGAFPSQATLAQLCSMGERTVREHLKTATVEGWLKRKRRYSSDGRRTTDAYECSYPKGYKLPAKSAASRDGYRRDSTPLPAENDQTYRRNLPGNLPTYTSNILPDLSGRENGGASTALLGTDKEDRADLSRFVRDKLRRTEPKVRRRTFELDMRDADRLHGKGTSYGEQLTAVQGFCSLRDRGELGTLVGPGEAASLAALLRTETRGSESVWERSLAEGYRLDPEYVEISVEDGS